MYREDHYPSRCTISVIFEVGEAIGAEAEKARLSPAGVIRRALTIGLPTLKERRRNGLAECVAGILQRRSVALSAGKRLGMGAHGRA